MPGALFFDQCGGCGRWAFCSLCPAFTPSAPLFTAGPRAIVIVSADNVLWLREIKITGGTAPFSNCLEVMIVFPRAFMKPILRFLIGNLLGDIAVGTVLVLKGSHFGGTCLVLSLWLPVTIVYAAVTAVALKRLGLLDLRGMMELCGLTVSTFPLFCGLWPTYMWVWDIAIFFMAIQCASLSTVVLARWLVFKMFHK